MFFLKIQTQNVLEKSFVDPFIKNRNRAYLWINSLKFYSIHFIFCLVVRYRNILKLSYIPIAFYKAFLMLCFQLSPFSYMTKKSRQAVFFNIFNSLKQTTILQRVRLYRQKKKAN